MFVYFMKIHEKCHQYPSSVMQLFEPRGIYKAVIMHERTLVVAAIDGTQGKQRRRREGRGV
jgi:hypothetical protein